MALRPLSWVLAWESPGGEDSGGLESVGLSVEVCPPHMGATLLWSPCLFGACMQQQSLLKESAVFLTMPHQPLGSSRLQPWVSVPAGWDAGMDEELIGKHLCPGGWEREQRRAGPGHVSEEKSLTRDPGGAQGPTGVRVSSGVLLPEGSGRRRPGQVALLAPAAGPREVDPGPPGCGQ